MADIDVIKSYLVSLGFEVDYNLLRKFQDALKQATGMAAESVAEMAGSFQTAAAAIIGAYAAVGAATVGLIEHTANADLEFRMFARRMFMGEDAAKRYKMALDALGISAADIVWGPPEIARRFTRLQEDMKTMQTGLGPDFRKNMEDIREFFFQFTRLGELIKFLFQGIAQDVFKAFGVEFKDFYKWLKDTNDYLVAHLPEITQQIDEYLIPVLQDAYVIVKDLWEITKMFFGLFSESGDATEGFKNLLWVVRQLSHVIAFLFEVVKQYLHVATGEFTAVKELVTGHPQEAWQALMRAETPLPFRNPWAAEAAAAATSAGSAITPKELADRVAAQTGIRADWLYGQMALETRNFTSKLFREKHNIAGITDPATGQFRSFGSYQESATELARILNLPRYAEARRATDLAGYNAGLRRGGFYGSDDPGSYLRGMASRAPLYYHAGGTTVTVNVSQPHASANEIAQVVDRKLRDREGKEIQRNLLQLQTVFR